MQHMFEVEHIVADRLQSISSSGFAAQSLCLLKQSGILNRYYGLELRNISVTLRGPPQTHPTEHALHLLCQSPARLASLAHTVGC